MVRTRPLCGFVFLVLALVGAASSNPANGQRSAFLDAERALQAGDQVTFSRLNTELKDYPLYPYLELQALKRRLDVAHAGLIISISTVQTAGCGGSATS